MNTLRVGFAAFACLFASVAAVSAAETPVAAAAAPAGPTQLVFVVDTSGSMRDPNRGSLYPAVARAIASSLAANPGVRNVAILDADGRTLLGFGPRGGLDQSQIARLLASVDTNSNSNPVPGVVRALRELAADPQARGTVCIVGDEFAGQADMIYRRFEELNPTRPDGTRQARIDAIQVPTLGKEPGKGPDSFVAFGTLMRGITAVHGGSFTFLPDL